MAHPTARLAALLTALCLACPAIVGAQTRERVAFVSVVDRKTGAPAADVTARDVVIREDRMAREVLRVSRATGPMPLAVLVDNSAAAENAIADLRAGLTAFAAALGDVGPVTIITMAERPTVLTNYTTSQATLTAGIGRLFSRPGSGVTMLEAVLETSRGLAKREGERAAIVVVGAGGQELSTLSYTTALDALKESGATLHAVMLNPPGTTRLDDPTRQRDMLLDRATTQTGGFRRDVLSSMAFGPALADLARVITNQFRVVYARPQTLIPPDTFEVAATAPGQIAYGAAARGQPK